MVERNDIERIAERIKTSQARLDRVEKYRLKITKQNRILRKKINHLIIHWLGNDNARENMNEITSKLEYLSNDILKNLEEEKRSLETLLHVIDHPKHLALILELFEKLPNNTKNIYQTHIDLLKGIFHNLRQLIINKAYPNVLQQEKAIKKFLDNKNITELLNYELLNREYSLLYDDFHKKLHPYQEAVKTSLKQIKKIIDKPAMIAEEHKLAMSLILLSVMILIPVVEFISIPAGSIGMLFLGLRRAHKVGKIFVEGIHIDEALHKIFKHS